MRARSAVLLALALALPLALAAAPPPARDLEAHAASAQLGTQLTALLARLEEAPAAGLPSAAELPGDAAAPAPRNSAGPLVPVHWLAGARGGTAWVSPGAPRELDLDGDGAAELRLHVGGGAWPALGVVGLAPAAAGWAVWVEEGPAKWGLAGAGLAPARADVRLLGGQLHVLVAGSGAEAWHAAYAHSGDERRALAWLAEGAQPWSLRGVVGSGFQVESLAPAAGGLRMMVVDKAQAMDLTLRDAPAQATVARDEAGALRYRAPQAGGALAYEGDAAPVGQRGDLTFAVEPLPQELTLAPEGEGFALEASAPSDVLLDWRPPGGEGVRIVGNGVQGLDVQPGATGGVVVRGERGTVAVLRPALGARGEEGVAQVADLGAQGAVAAGARSPWPAVGVALALGSAVLWAAAPRLGLGARGRA